MCITSQLTFPPSDFHLDVGPRRRWTKTRLQSSPSVNENAFADSQRRAENEYQQRLSCEPAPTQNILALSSMLSWSCKKLAVSRTLPSGRSSALVSTVNTFLYSPPGPWFHFLHGHHSRFIFWLESHATKWPTRLWVWMQKKAKKDETIHPTKINLMQRGIKMKVR